MQIKQSTTKPRMLSLLQQAWAIHKMTPSPTCTIKQSGTEKVVLNMADSSTAKIYDALQVSWFQMRTNVF
jgi:hypothetical protein